MKTGRPTDWTAAQLREAKAMHDRGYHYNAIDRHFGKARGSSRGMLRRHFSENGPDLEKIAALAEREEIRRQKRANDYVPERPRVPAAVLAERDRTRSIRQSLTAAFFGDPTYGRSALDRMLRQ